MVFTPYSARTVAVFSPTPHNREIGSGSRNSTSVPGSTTTSPSGLRRSLAIFATSFVVATPTDAVSRTSPRIASLIARAIVSDPTFLICDEPTGDLDRHSAEEILGLLQTLNREHGKTIVMVTHDPKAAEYATHTIHLDKGELTDAPAPAH